MMAFLLILTIGFSMNGKGVLRIGPYCLKFNPLNILFGFFNFSI
ncbi:NADH-ubiquinone oxidoreductase chain 3 [Bienertia sinuspersici]